MTIWSLGTEEGSCVQFGIAVNIIQLKFSILYKLQKYQFHTHITDVWTELETVLFYNFLPI